MEEERKRVIKSDNTPEQKLIGENFAENKGRLPWPVEKGIITSQFGIQKHPVLKYVTENNIGIEITSSGKTAVRSIFKGEVAKVFSIPGANMTVIIRHGKYLSVYQNVVDLKIKQGDKVETKQEIGDVFCETDNGNKAILKFMIFEEKKILIRNYGFQKISDIYVTNILIFKYNVWQLSVMYKKIKIESQIGNLRIVENAIDEATAVIGISQDNYGKILVSTMEAVNNAITAWKQIRILKKL